MHKILSYLRMSAAVGLMLSALALLALWARSYWHSDGIYFRQPESSFRVSSREGSLHCVVDAISFRTLRPATPPNVRYEWRTSSEAIRPKSGPPAPNRYNPLWLLQFRRGSGVSYLNVPHWLVITLLAAAGATLWRWSGRFALRTMLILTTIVAVLLGMATRE